MRYGQAFNALFTQAVHPLPQAFRVLGIEAGKRQGRQAPGIAENHIAVQVAARIRGRGVLEGGKGGEAARIVGIVRGVDTIQPGDLADRCHQVGVDAAFQQAIQYRRQKVAESFAAFRQAEFGHVVRRIDIVQRFAQRVAGKFAVGVGSFLYHAEQHGVVGYRIEIHRLLQLYCVAARVVDRLPPGIAVGVCWRGGGAEHIGIERVRCMHVQVAEVGVTLRVGRWAQVEDLGVGGEQGVLAARSSRDPHRLVGLHTAGGLIAAGPECQR